MGFWNFYVQIYFQKKICDWKILNENVQQGKVNMGREDHCAMALMFHANYVIYDFDGASVSLYFAHDYLSKALVNCNVGEI